jgi:hypothetical protein
MRTERNTDRVVWRSTIVGLIAQGDAAPARREHHRNQGADSADDEQDSPAYQ